MYADIYYIHSHTSFIIFSQLTTDSTSVGARVLFVFFTPFFFSHFARFPRAFNIQIDKIIIALCSRSIFLPPAFFFFYLTLRRRMLLQFSPRRPVFRLIKYFFHHLLPIIVLVGGAAVHRRLINLKNYFLFF